MRNPRISISDQTWAQTRARAAGENKTTSTVVEDALTEYLKSRSLNTSAGSAVPSFTGAVSSQDVQLTSVEHPVHGTETKREVITGIRPVPKPGQKRR